MGDRLVLWVALCALCGVSCGGAAGTDAGRDATADGPACRTDVDCSDGTFCDGIERCAPGPGADGRGCLAARPPCLAGQTCDEAADSCTTDCAMTRDADGDGHAAPACGGDDCDDSDPSRYPGAVEICDGHDYDEDCDPRTFGTRDADGDGHIDAACCNVDSGGMRHCGDDCADTVPAIHPSATEVCNAIDDDCNGMIDEGVTATFHPDADGDGFGSASGAARVACVMPAGFVASATDCDDTSAQVHPGAARVCNGVDDECAGAPDVGCPVGLAAGAVTDRLTKIGPGTPGADDVCPAGQVLVALHVEVGFATDIVDEVEEVSGTCGVATVNEDRSAVPYTYTVTVVPGGSLPARGAHPVPPGPITDAACPADTVAVGMHGITDGAWLGGLSLDCAAMTIRGSPGGFAVGFATPTMTATSGGVAGTSVHEPCPAGEAVVGYALGPVSFGFTAIQFLCGPMAIVLRSAP